MLSRLLRGLAQAWVILGISLVLLLLVDHLLRAILPSVEDVQFDAHAKAPNRARVAAVQADRAWIDAYWADHSSARHSQWRSYVYWRRAPFVGKHINIDAHGFRVTPAPAVEERRTLWLFGGSTAWGTGNRDSGTLAAQLQALYAKYAPELGVRVRNFGESGYVSQQSALSFQLALRCDEPAADMAIFLDGPNDAFATLQSGQAGNPQNESNRQREFNSSNHLRKLMTTVLARFDGIARLARKPPPLNTDALIDDWAAQTARSYVATLRQSQALAQAFGVDLLYAWQPTVFDRKVPAADEAAILGASSATHVRLQRETRRQVQAAFGADLALPAVDLGGVFDDQAEAVFFDFVHLSEAGQGVLAEQLYRLSVAKMNARTPHSARVDQCMSRPLG